jgi:hypothetical protein
MDTHTRNASPVVSDAQGHWWSQPSPKQAPVFTKKKSLGNTNQGAMASQEMKPQKTCHGNKKTQRVRRRCRARDHRNNGILPLNDVPSIETAMNMDSEVLPCTLEVLRWFHGRHLPMESLLCLIDDYGHINETKEKYDNCTNNARRNQIVESTITVAIITEEVEESASTREEADETSEHNLSVSYSR